MENNNVKKKFGFRHWKSNGSGHLGLFICLDNPFGDKAINKSSEFYILIGIGNHDFTIGWTYDNL